MKHSEPASLETPTGDSATSAATAVAGVLAAPMEALIREIDRITEPEDQTQPMAQEQFDADLIVIGAGPGGYVGAIRAAQLGASVIVVEREYLGGVCLNWGCIPSKAMIAGAHLLDEIKHAGTFGINVPEGTAVDFEKYMARKQKVVETLRGGVGMLFKKNKIRHIEGAARFTDAHTIEIEKDGQKQSIRGKKFMLAMGSSVIHLKIPGLDGGRDQGVWTSDDAVTAPFIPKRMLVLGGGAVGCEFSYVFNKLGTEITLVEMMPNLLPLMDSDLGVELGKSLTKSGIKVRTGASLEKVERVGDVWKCTVKKGTDEEVVEADVVLLGVGRKANTEGMGLEEIGVKLHKRGVELANEEMQTHVPHIYAVGDVTGRIQLAHVAMYEGQIAAYNIVKEGHRTPDYKTVPNAVYTYPEVASVGITEGEAREKGYDVVTGKAMFRTFGRAIATGQTEGFVKVVAEKKYGEVLGLHMIGAGVTDLIHEGSIALKLEATLESIADAIHAHPTMSECVLEAFEDALGHAIHKM